MMTRIPYTARIHLNQLGIAWLSVTVGTVIFVCLGMTAQALGLPLLGAIAIGSIAGGGAIAAIQWRAFQKLKSELRVRAVVQRYRELPKDERKNYLVSITRELQKKINSSYGYALQQRQKLSMARMKGVRYRAMMNDRGNHIEVRRATENLKKLEEYDANLGKQIDKLTKIRSEITLFLREVDGDSVALKRTVETIKSLEAGERFQQRGDQLLKSMRSS